MQIAVNEYSIPGPRSARWDQARALGIDGLELVVGPYGTGRHPLGCNKNSIFVRHCQERTGLTLASVVAGFFLAPSPGLSETISRQQLFQDLARLLRIAAEAGSTVVVVPLLGQAEPRDDAITQALVDLLKPAAREAAELGLRLALHSALPVDQLQALLARLDEPALGIAYDPGLSRSVGQDPVVGLKLLAAEIIQLRLSDVDAHGCRVPLGQGICGLPAVLRQLLDLPGKPWTVLVPTSHPDPQLTVLQSVSWLRKLNMPQGLFAGGSN